MYEKGRKTAIKVNPWSKTSSTVTVMNRVGMLDNRAVSQTEIYELSGFMEFTPTQK